MFLTSKYYSRVYVIIIGLKLTNYKNEYSSNIRQKSAQPPQFMTNTSYKLRLEINSWSLICINNINPFLQKGKERWIGMSFNLVMMGSSQKFLGNFLKQKNDQDFSTKPERIIKGKRISYLKYKFLLVSTFYINCTY